MIAFRKIIDVCRAFGIEGDPVRYKTFTDGHINSTFLVVFSDKGELHKYLVQNINTVVFKDPDALMENIVRVTHYLRKQIRENGGDPERETLHFRKTTDGALCLHDGDYCWRIYAFIDHSFTYDLIEDSAIFRSAGESFGRFQRLLANYPIESLYETIPDFHNTPDRYRKFDAALRADPLGRAAGVGPEIDFVLSRREEAGTLQRMREDGTLPLRVTHNDTKLNNVMLDAKTRRALCVIDLDTVMPGLAAYDFGDSIRFGASTAAEDERDLERVSLDLGLYEIFVRGFVPACGTLTDAELESLPWGARLMTLECGLRFLTDYLSGDVYFSIAFPEHNLVRARNQFRLVEDMEAKWEDMRRIVRGGLSP